MMEADLSLQTYLKHLRLATVAANYRRFAEEAAQASQRLRALPASPVRGRRATA